MADDRDYMNGDDAPADFQRRRVAGVLRREKPCYENGDETSWNGILALGKIHASSTFGGIKVGKLKVLTNNLFGKIKTYLVIHLDTIPYPKWMLKKPANSNLHSRYFTPPRGG
jgi:hypothetical protein